MNNPNLKPPMDQDSANRIDSRLDAALETKPSMQIPAGFAAKVVALAVAQGRRPRPRVPQIGRSMALIFAPLVTIALFVLAPHSSPNVKSIIFDTEVILIAQLALIGWWVTRAPVLRSQPWR
jgi:hypothetical protein